MIKMNKTTTVLAKIEDGTYECKLKSITDGKTLNDTRFDFTIVGGKFDGRNLINFTNNSKVIWSDEEGNGWTSEDFFMNGLARQLCDGGEISYEDIITQLQDGALITLYVTHNESFQNVSSTKPKMEEAVEGLDI